MVGWTVASRVWTAPWQEGQLLGQPGPGIPEWGLWGRGRTPRAASLPAAGACPQHSALGTAGQRQTQPVGRPPSSGRALGRNVGSGDDSGPAQGTKEVSQLASPLAHTWPGPNVTPPTPRRHCF